MWMTEKIKNAMITSKKYKFQYECPMIFVNCTFSLSLSLSHTYTHTEKKEKEREKVGKKENNVGKELKSADDGRL